VFNTKCFRGALGCTRDDDAPVGCDRGGSREGFANRPFVMARGDEREPLLPTTSATADDGGGGTRGATPTVVDVGEGRGGRGGRGEGDGTMGDVKDDVASSSSSMGTVSMATLAVGLWFWMNIANNIELQEFHASVRFGNDALILRLEAMTFVTLVQMAIGLVVGVCLKLAIGRGATLMELVTGCTSFLWTLGVLHAGGALFTNLGFMFASASFVQVVKLIEPWEMLMIDISVRKWIGKALQLSLGVVLSMALVVGSAVSLTVETLDRGRPLAVFFALLSGLFITSRIVFQKTFRFSDESKSGFVPALDEYLIMAFGALIFLSAAFLVEYSSARIKGENFVNVMELVELFTVELVVYQPLYHLFSLMTLTFVASITHSLLNVFKRVLGLVITIYWFQEEMTLRVMIGCAVAFIGGCWYTIEKHGASLPGGAGMKIALFGQRRDSPKP